MSDPIFTPAPVIPTELPDRVTQLEATVKTLAAEIAMLQDKPVSTETAGILDVRYQQAIKDVVEKYFSGDLPAVPVPTVG